RARRVAVRPGIRDQPPAPVRGGSMKHPHNHRPRWLPTTLALVAAVTLLGACGSSSKPSSSGNPSGTAGLKVPTADMPTLQSIGQGEGKLNLIAWDGYTEPEWVKPFETASGCKVNTKVGTTSSDMVSLMANGGGGQYDMVSASGDADLRLI